MSPAASVRNADLLRPEVIRNEIQSTTDQMERINLGDGYASAQNTFPLVNLDDPTEAWYTFGGSAGPMRPTAFDAESPVGTIEVPDKRNVNIQSYKEKFNPDKGAETHYSNTPYSVFARAVQKIQQKIFLTREQVTWRGDSAIPGLIGQHGTDPHPELLSQNVISDGTDWSDSATAEPIAEIEDINYETTANGFFGEGIPAAPVLYAPPSVLRDLKRTEEMRDVLGYDGIQRVTMDAVSDIFDEELGGIQRVMVQLPRTDALGNYVNADGDVVDSIDDAAHDNALEPYDPDTGEQVRNVIIGRMGPSTAYVPWFLDRLTERLDGADMRGEFSVEGNEGYFVQRWSDEDPVASWIKGAMEIGFEIHRPENVGLISGV
jgi:hypothetical protein